tara:strand:+ start:867 stop:1928 length:1062 start_codon:yes stop_codon:yes gene_type:complete
MAVDNSPSNSANHLNITIQNESENYRNIRRNSSNQIVSYSIKEDEQPDEYGFKRIPGSIGMFNKTQYERIIPRLSNELLVTPVEFETQIIEQNRLDETKIYKVQNQSIRSVRGAEAAEPEDTFSGRYELTSEALSRRDKEPGEIVNSQREFRNTHFGGISFHDNEVRSATDGYITHKGRKEIVWDNKVFGPELQQYGYRVTKELKESGRNLQIRAVVGAQISHPSSNINFYASIMRKRPGRTNEENSKIVKDGGRTYLKSEQPHWPMIVLEYELSNNQLQVNDVFQVATVTTTRNDGTFIMGDKCVFEVNCPLPSDPPIPYPANTNTGGNAGVTTSNLASSDLAEADTSNDTR